MMAKGESLSFSLESGSQIETFLDIFADKKNFFACIKVAGMPHCGLSFVLSACEFLHQTDRPSA